MSLMNHSVTHGNPAKRRKLSHSSNDEPDHTSDDEFDTNMDSQSAMEGTDRKSRSVNTQMKRRTIQRQPNVPSSVRTVPTSGSSIFSVQFNELLVDHTRNYDARLAKIRSTLDHLESLIRGISAPNPMSTAEAETLMRRASVVIPFPLPAPGKESNLKFAYEAPTSIMRTGPLANGLALKGDNEWRLVLEMPKNLLQEKDYLNFRAFHKRAFYLANVAKAINQDDSHGLNAVYLLDDDLHLLPALRITGTTSQTNQKHDDYSIIVTVGFSQNSFSLEKTSPTSNCVRINSSTGETAPETTPFYNSCLRMQAAFEHYNNLMSATKQKCSAFADACRAGQLWLIQRGVSSGISSGGFGSWEWAIMCALLLRTGGHRDHPLFSERYSSLQLYKAMLQVLSSRDLTDPWCMNGDARVPKTNLPVLFDAQTGVNILYKMSSWSYQSLRQAASLTLAAINSKQDDIFDATFTVNVTDIRLKYDAVYALKIPQSLPLQAHSQNSMIHKAHDIIQRGLGDRVSLIETKTKPATSWPVAKPRPVSKEQAVGVGVMLNSENASRLIDHGPSADDQEAGAEFRAFWGDKAELRRFKDGSINESLIWSEDEPVVLQILHHLFKRHLSIQPTSVTPNSTDLAGQLQHFTAEMRAVEAFRTVNEQFQKLSSALHELEGLPLPIRAINPADAALRSSSIMPPLLSMSSEPIAILIQFDSSTRWPDSLPAIQYTKIAFLTKLADLLASSDSDLTTRVGLENTSTSSSGYANTSFLDITYPSHVPNLSPITFRLRIYHDRELHLIQSSLTNKSLHGSTRDALTSALLTQKRVIASPVHTNSIRALCTRFPPLSTTIRLLKKWISSHLLLRHVSEEVLEIITAHIFLHPYPWSTPGSSTTAFFRCLSFLSRWDWAYEPLIVDLSLSQDMTAAQREDIKIAFEAWRQKLDPSMNQVVWFVGTNLDPTGVVWTQAVKPAKVVASRITALASAAMELVRSKGLDLTGDDAADLFRSPLEQYDFLLHLKPSVLRRRGKGQPNGSGNKNKFKNLELSVQTPLEEVGFDPVELYVQDLETAFGHVAMFFYDQEGGELLAGLWRPNVTGRREWRVRLGWSSTLVRNQNDDGEKVDCEANLEGMVREMEMMGLGLLRKVEILKG